MERNPNRILVIDDEPGIREFIGDVAQDMGFEVLTTGDPDEFRDAAINSFLPSLIIMDLQMPQVDGIELLRFLGQETCTAKVMLASGMDQRVLTTAEQLGASQGLSMLGVLQKPIMLPDLEAALSAIFQAPRSITEKDLAEAIDKEQLEVFYQPKASLQPSGQWLISGAEALVRWHHPHLGMVFPDEFIPLAENTGLISPLTQFVLKDAIKQIYDWNATGLDIGISVNLAPQLVVDLDFPDRLSSLLAEHGVDNSKLTMEITETAAISDPARTMDILTRLRVKNIGLAMDDFGTGFSSLTQLYRMPFNEIKIDKSLIFDVPQSEEANTMVRSIVELAHNLGLTVCAEGVENQAALDFLTNLDCDAVQGYFFARPDSAAATEQFIRTWNGQLDQKAVAD